MLLAADSGLNFILADALSYIAVFCQCKASVPLSDFCKFDALVELLLLL